MVKGQTDEKTESIKGFLEYFKEDVDDFIYNQDEEVTIDAIFSSEYNFNNADPSSQQRIYSKEDISSLLEDSIEYLCSEEDRCSECAKPISDDDYFTDSQNHPYGDSYATETIVVGYKCSGCGHEENF